MKTLSPNTKSLIFFLLCISSSAIAQMVDTRFKSPELLARTKFLAMAETPGRKIIVALDENGISYYYGSTQINSNLVRLTSRGQRDGTFNTNFTGRAGAIIPYKSESFFVIDRQSGFQLVLLSGTGRVMRRFDIYGVNSVIVLPDYSFIVSATYQLSKYKSNLTLDASFGDGGFLDMIGYVLDMELQDSNVIVAGNFTHIGDTPIVDVARLKPNGVVDQTFYSGEGTSVNIESIHLQPDGKILIGNTYVEWYDGHYFGGSTVRLHPDGEVDEMFETEYWGKVTNMTWSNGKIISSSGWGGVNRLNEDGSHDLSFPTIWFSDFTDYPNMLVLKSGDILVAHGIDDHAEYGLTKFNREGERYASFNPPIAQAGRVRAMIPVDDKLLIAGDFFKVNGERVNYIARLTSTGTLDRTFELTDDLGQLYVLDKFANGKLLAKTDYGLKRLNSDGSVDESFSFESEDFDPWSVKLFKILPNDKILYQASWPQNGLGQSNSDGSVDHTFSSVFSNGYNDDYDVQPDGKIVYCGNFTTLNGVPTNGIVRLHPDGNVDESFDIGSGPNGYVQQLSILNDGGIWVEGPFYEFNGHAAWTAAKLKADGSVDVEFLTNLLGNFFAYESPTISFRNGVAKYGLADVNFKPTLAKVNNEGISDESLAPRRVEFGPALLASPDDRTLYAANHVWYSGKYKSVIRLKYRAMAPVEEINETARQIQDVPFALYPNPSHEYIAFDTAVPLKISIISSGGKVEIESQVSGSERLDISGLQPGRYVVRTRNPDGKITTSHVIKE